MKKFIVCLAILAFVGYAQAADVLIGSWESGTNEGWADHPATAGSGWTATYYVDDPALLGRYDLSYDWSTEGYVSLKADVTGWDWFERHDVMSVWFDHDTIEFDICATLQDGSTATWAQVEKIAGSFETAESSWFDMPDAQFFAPDLAGTTLHCAYNYREDGFAGSEYCDPADAYGSIIIAYNADAPVYLYIDNIMFTGVPEPATIGLLGLGGLALLRRKR